MIPLFLIAVVPEGFFTWQVIIIFAVLMSIPFIAAWLYNRSEPDGPSTFEMYSETLKRNNELKDQEKDNNKPKEGSM